MKVGKKIIIGGTIGVGLLAIIILMLKKRAVANTSSINYPANSSGKGNVKAVNNQLSDVYFNTNIMAGTPLSAYRDTPQNINDRLGAANGVSGVSGGLRAYKDTPENIEARRNA